jgi:hypothetical protein
MSLPALPNRWCRWPVLSHPWRSPCPPLIAAVDQKQHRSACRLYDPSLCWRTCAKSFVPLLRTTTSAGNEALTSKSRQGSLHSGMLGIVAGAIAEPVPLYLVDLGDNVEGCRSLPGLPVTLYDAQALTLYPTETSGHWASSVSVPQATILPFGEHLAKHSPAERLSPACCPFSLHSAATARTIVLSRGFVPTRIDRFIHYLPFPYLPIGSYLVSLDHDLSCGTLGVSAEKPSRKIEWLLP